MPAAVIVDAVRTPIGRRDGLLGKLHAVDLAARPLESLVARTGIDPGLIEDVIMGCVMQTGEQGLNVGRSAALAAGFPDSVAGTTVDRQCGSSQQAAHFAAQGVMAGAYDVVIAAGVESMTRVPMGVTAYQGPGQPFGPTVKDRYQLVPQGISAGLIAREWSLTREQLDSIAFDSHQRAARATSEGRFVDQMVPLDVGLATAMTTDEGIRAEISAAELARLRPAFEEDGVVTAGNVSQISDGAAAVLIMSESKAESLGLEPMARFRSFSLVGVDPVTMLTGPILATERVLKRAGLSIDDIDLVEVNEAFASVIGAWLADTDPTGDLWSRTNVNGGAIALGHPLGASGARLLTTLVHELKRTGKRYGLQTMSEGGGMANGLIIERL
ncbi:MAG: thiolase family protein [Acidimicrobiia bacterium]|nr:thiolase family protein [Acidimicrobiia bacterium]